ncbi:DUF1501 domain-containing protein [Prosthecobacter sp.]|uniref:DUF1501 domain-containing protein n=1 Tax=Prosthecobacter sp. TaxID=1965333 RepID=UPI002ABBD233|nr:DUF1501 domain-containing protein [Prosthecobacter sp.]MDZ4404259.1 DUF1501 domain-containing protein [Prosthecobacter sp.]
MHPLTRRQILQHSGAGFGSLALQSLLDADGVLSSTNPLAPRAPHFAPKAKSVIFLFMYGGPSHVDLLDPKPELEKWHGKAIPVWKPEDAFMGRKTKNVAMQSYYRFAKHGQAGIDMAETFPNLARHADDLCVIRSMHAESNNHGPAIFQMNTGFILPGRPCMGSWVTYGLGSESENLPAFVVLLDHQGAPVNGALNWSNGFMPASYQGVPFRSSGEPIAYLTPPKSVSQSQQRARLDLLKQWNTEFAAANPAETQLAARINTYELAYRMQMSASECTDFSREPECVRKMYGLDNKVTAHFGKNCLLARRLVERGVRFVQVYSGGNEGPKAWDAHDDLKKNHDLHCAETDGPIAALLDDLKISGMLDSTLVVWGGEFGRSPVAENGKGRDHHPKGFTMWMAGGGIKGGQIYGATDEFGYSAIENKVSVPDLHATMLHQLGLDHEQLTYRFTGRDYRLTDVSGEVVKALLA